MISKKATIKNANGIHVRPSIVISTAVQDYAGTISIQSAEDSIDQVNTMNLLTLGLTAGDTITIQVSGPDEGEICGKLVRLFETHFDFPPRENVTDTEQDEEDFDD